MTYDVEDDEQAKYRKPLKLLKCDSRYVVPKTDEYIERAPDGTVMSNRDGSPRVASASRDRAMNSYAMASGYVFGSPQPTEMDGSVAPTNAKKSHASGRRAARAQAPVVQAAFDAAWPPG